MPPWRFWLFWEGKLCCGAWGQSPEIESIARLTDVGLVAGGSRGARSSVGLSCLCAGCRFSCFAVGSEGRERQDGGGQDEMTRDGEETGVGIQWALLERQNRRDAGFHRLRRGSNLCRE